MAGFLIDSNILVQAIRGKKGRRELLRKFVVEGHTLVYSAITLGEIYAGMKPHEAVITTEILDSMECYPATCELLQKAGEIKQSRSRLGFQHGLPDMIILATAIEHDLTLVTENVKDFPTESIYPLEQ